MMPYIDRHLVPGERVVFRTRFHPVMFSGTVFFAACVAGIAALIVHRNELAPETVRILWLAAALTSVLACVSPYFRWRTSEFAVTTASAFGFGLLRDSAKSVSGNSVSM